MGKLFGPHHNSIVLKGKVIAVLRYNCGFGVSEDNDLSPIRDITEKWARKLLQGANQPRRLSRRRVAIYLGSRLVAVLKIDKPGHWEVATIPQMGIPVKIRPVNKPTYERLHDEMLDIISNQ